MRMLFACRPTAGHIFPLLPLAEAARAAGHMVTFATAPAVLPVLTARGFDTAAAGEDRAIIASLSGPNAPPLEDHRRIAFTRFFGGVELEPRLRDIEAIIAARRPDVLVHELAELATPVAAAAAGIPLITVGFGPLLDPKVAEATAEAAAPAWRARGLAPARWAGLYRDLYLDPCPPALQVPEIADLPAVQPIRNASGEAAPPPGWLTGDGDPLVYLTFGTIFNRDAEMFRTAIEALRSLPVRLLVTVGQDNDPADFDPDPPRVRIERFIPQEAILARCRLVVSHAGAGTMLGALAFGAPMLLIPLGADQLYNAERCSTAGAALMLRRVDASVDAIAAAAARLLVEPGFSARARAVAAEMAAMPGPFEALRRIEAIAAR